MWPVLIGIGVLIVFIVCAAVASVEAEDRGRSSTGGALVGFLLGPVGVAIVLLLPRPTASPTRSNVGERKSIADQATPHDRALDLLRERYATGDLTSEEFQRMRRELTE